MNKGLTPISVSRTAALLVALTTSACTLVFPRFIKDWELWYAVIVFVSVLVLSYTVFFIGIRLFIQNRVDQIHRTVHDVKTARNPDELDMGEDILGQISDDVQEWADEKREEIAELKERESYRREFIGNLAHELKTPITSIQGYILTLLEGGLEDENVNRKFLERASNGVDRLIAIVQDMDTITRLEEGVMQLDMDVHDLHGLVEHVMDAMGQLAKKSGIELRNEVNPYTMVMCDDSRIMQVFTNLLNNSIKYGEKGGYVRIGSYFAGNRVMIEIADNGIGIDSVHLPRLFERFYRVGSSRSRHSGGSGLGLAIVKHIVEAHGQAITVVSESEKGTRFTLSLSKG